MANQFTIDDIAKLAEIDSAKTLPFIVVHGEPRGHLLEVVAQRSGFNWELHISVAEILVDEEYWPYYVVEIKEGPDWPKNAGHGPVIPKTTLHTDVIRRGTKGIAVIGSNKTITLNL